MSTKNDLNPVAIAAAERLRVALHELRSAAKECDNLLSEAALEIIVRRSPSVTVQDDAYWLALSDDNIADIETVGEIFVRSGREAQAAALAFEKARR